MAEISPNLVAAPPTVGGIAAALAQAQARADDFDAPRARQAPWHGATDWRSAFDDDDLARIIDALA